MNRQTFVKELIRLFSEVTNCKAQFNGCPCNTCFHALYEEDIDYQHIVWLILLALRGDYKDSYQNILDNIKDELKEDK